jgi:hypothetical protein
VVKKPVRSVPSNRKVLDCMPRARFSHRALLHLAYLDALASLFYALGMLRRVQPQQPLDALQHAGVIVHH